MKYESQVDSNKYQAHNTITNPNEKLYSSTSKVFFDRNKITKNTTSSEIPLLYSDKLSRLINSGKNRVVTENTYNYNTEKMLSDRLSDEQPMTEFLGS